MKKIVLLSLAVAALSAPAFAADEMNAPNTDTKGAANGMITASTTTKVKLKDNKEGYTWALIGSDKSVKVTKNGTTWVAAPDGKWVSYDGKITLVTKDGNKV